MRDERKGGSFLSSSLIPHPSSLFSPPSCLREIFGSVDVDKKIMCAVEIAQTLESDHARSDNFKQRSRATFTCRYQLFGVVAANLCAVKRAERLPSAVRLLGDYSVKVFPQGGEPHKKFSGDKRKIAGDDRRPFCAAGRKGSMESAERAPFYMNILHRWQ